MCRTYRRVSMRYKGKNKVGRESRKEAKRSFFHHFDEEINSRKASGIGSRDDRWIVKDVDAPWQYFCRYDCKAARLFYIDTLRPAINYNKRSNYITCTKVVNQIKNFQMHSRW